VVSATQVKRVRSVTRTSVAGGRSPRFAKAELRLAAHGLGVHRCDALDYRDGTSPTADYAGLVGDVRRSCVSFRPDVVISFGPDGGYGHPDHIAISAATTAACEQASGVGCSSGDPPCPPGLAVPPALPHRATCC
jgi:LmbE family N-acetylglucosaminyl deacetylase